MHLAIVILLHKLREKGRIAITKYFLFIFHLIEYLAALAVSRAVENTSKQAYDPNGKDSSAEPELQDLWIYACICTAVVVVISYMLIRVNHFHIREQLAKKFGKQADAFEMQEFVDPSLPAPPKEPTSEATPRPTIRALPSTTLSKFLDLISSALFFLPVVAFNNAVSWTIVTKSPNPDAVIYASWIYAVLVIVFAVAVVVGLHQVDTRVRMAPAQSFIHKIVLHKGSFDQACKFTTDAFGWLTATSTVTAINLTRTAAFGDGDNANALAFTWGYTATLVAAIVALLVLVRRIAERRKILQAAKEDTTSPASERRLVLALVMDDAFQVYTTLVNKALSKLAAVTINDAVTYTLDPDDAPTPASLAVYAAVTTVVSSCVVLALEVVLRRRLEKLLKGTEEATCGSQGRLCKNEEEGEKEPASSKQMVLRLALFAYTNTLFEVVVLAFSVLTALAWTGAVVAGLSSSAEGHDDRFVGGLWGYAGGTVLLAVVMGVVAVRLFPNEVVTK